MRVTNNMLVRKLTRSINTASANLDTISERVSTGMKFSRASQDTAGALKAFKIRRSLLRTEQYRTNIRDIQGVYDETESALSGIYEVLIKAKDCLLQAANGTMADENREAAANIFIYLREQLLKLGNTNFAGKYILGGPNTTSAPFTVVDGKLFYNDEDMENPSVSTEELYADIGLGLSFDASGKVDPQCAISMGVPGSVVMGYGTDASGLPNNIYNLFSQIITSLKNNDISDVERYIQKLSEKSDDIMVQITGIGERSNFIEFLDDRLSLDELNLKKKQNAVETVDTAQAIMDYKVTEMTYRAALQMGSKILSVSLLDFLR